MNFEAIALSFSDFWSIMIVRIIVYGLAIIFGILIGVVGLSYAERRVLAAIQGRFASAAIGSHGLIQPFADGLKLFSKEMIIPTGAHRVSFVLAPMVLFILSLLAWVVIPFDKGVVLANINVGVLFLISVLSLNIFGMVMAGWASHSRYAFLGGVRAVAQMISYQISMGLVIVCIVLVTGSLNLEEIVLAPRPVWVHFLLLPMFIIFLICALAACNRPPFDVSNARSELAGGYMAEYSGVGYALFLLSERICTILMGALTCILFLGGWMPPFGFSFLSFVPGIFWFASKTALILFIFIWMQATLPRVRYDQLMRLGWKAFLPFTLVWVLLIAGFLIVSNTLPGMEYTLYEGGILQ